MNGSIFFCNGFMSVLASCLLAELLIKENPNRKLVLCIEKNTHVSAVYYDILNLLIKQSKCFCATISIECQLLTPAFYKPIEYMKSMSYYRNKACEIKAQLNSIGVIKIDEVWAPYTSRLWPFFKGNSNSRNLIEHGLGEYLALNSKPSRSIKTSLKYFVGRIMGWVDYYEYDKAHLCCGFLPPNQNRAVEVYDFAAAIGKYIEGFWKSYKEDYPVSYSEINFLARRTGLEYDRTYIYIASDEVRMENYSQYVSDQLNHFGIEKNSTFILKPHPSFHHVSYSNFFPCEATCIQVSKIENIYIPIEFLVYHLGIKKVIGSCSSSLYYIGEWMPSVRRHIYNNYEITLVKPADLGFANQMINAGLLSPSQPRAVVGNL